jgi:hypothetical protein
MPEREFRLVLPRVDNAGNHIRADVLRVYVEDMAARFGGATVFPHAIGCEYLNAPRTTHCEDVLVVETIAQRDTQEQINADVQWMLDLATRAAAQLGQEGVFDQQILGSRTTFAPGVRQAQLPPYLISNDPLARL